MAKRKIFVKVALNGCAPDNGSGRPDLSDLTLPPIQTFVDLDLLAGRGSNRFNFASLYGIGVDQVTHACQQQIERFLNKQDMQLERLTVADYCFGLTRFLQYLGLRSVALRRDLTLGDINRNVIDGYLVHLGDGTLSTVSQKNYYTKTKAVLKILCKRGLIGEVLAGNEATFPPNPFPGAHRKSKGEQPLPKAQRQAFALAVKTDVMPIFSEDVEPTAYVLVCALLVIALHTGRNTSPLLDMSADCLRPHPKVDLLFLVVYKRRGHTTSKVALKVPPEEDIDSMPTVRSSVARLIRRVIALSERLQSDATETMRTRIWLYRRQRSKIADGAARPVTSLSSSTLNYCVKDLVRKHKLIGADGAPLRINVSRLRKTFVNRMFEVMDGDVVGTAAAAGNTVRVTEVSYLRPGEDSKRNWKFMGTALTQELLTSTVGASDRTPMGGCTDNKGGEYAPNREGASCMSFLNCLRCSNYVVTGDDLHRLFSFYWRVLGERPRMDVKRWRNQFAHVVRLIDRDVIEVGLSKGVFTQASVDSERERARQDPHPFWRNESIMAALTDGAL